jgi:radical SAM superfamily enzyme YgiQ (UPF0313 family)
MSDSLRGIFFTGNNRHTHTYLKNIGAYRLRTLCAEEGYRTDVINHTEHMTYDDIIQICENSITKETLFIALSATFLTEVAILLRVESAFLEIKKRFPWVKFIFGGAVRWNPNPNVFDIRMIGFSDISFKDLLMVLDGKKRTLKYYYLKDGITHIQALNYGSNFDGDKLDTVWLPEDDIRPTDALPIEISRGCIFKCSFCAYELNGKKKFDYFRTKESLRKELQYNYDNFGVTQYIFLDDTYNDSREKLDLIDSVLNELDFKIAFDCFIKPELLKTRPDTIQRMSDQGLISCTMGIESINHATRKTIGKGMDYFEIEPYIKMLKESTGRNITIQYSMMVGLQYDTEITLRDAYEYLKKQSFIDSLYYGPLVMYEKDELSKMESNPENYSFVYADRNLYDDMPENEQWEGLYKTYDEWYRLNYNMASTADIFNWKNTYSGLDFIDAIKLSAEFNGNSFHREGGEDIAGIGGPSGAAGVGIKTYNENGALQIDVTEWTENGAWKEGYLDRAKNYINNCINRYKGT